MNGKQRFDFREWLRSRTGLVFLAFLAIAVFFPVTEHTAHFFGVLPYLLLFLCPLLHLFMHSSHGSHAGHAESTGHVGHIEGGSQQNSEEEKK